MKSCPADLATDIDLPQTTLALLMLLKRKDGTVIGLTEFDQELDFTTANPLVIYNGAVAYLPLLNRFNINKKVNEDGSSTTELEGPIDDTTFTRDDLLARRFDSADMQILLVNWNDLSHDCVVMSTGFWGDVEIHEYSFKVPLKGLSFRLAATGGELCQAGCRVDFGSPKCAPGGALADGTTIDSLMQAGTVTGSDGFEAIFCSGIADLGKPLIGGLLTFTGGNNNNLSVEVKFVSFDDPGAGITYIRFKLPTLLQINAGDTFQLQPACDKKFDTCANVWKNAVNNQAEAFLPGPDNILANPDWHVSQSSYGRT